MRSRYASARALTLMQHSELKLGPGLPQDRETGAYATADIATAYERQPRCGFDTFAGLREAWEMFGDQLMEDDPGPWWAFQQFSLVKVGDLVGGDEK
jgi:hypothetical protein